MPGPLARRALPVFLLAALSACGHAPVHDASAGAPPASPVPHAIAIDEVDVATLQARLRSGSLSSHALTQAYLDRIAAIDDAGPTLDAVIELNPDALHEADARDADGEFRGVARTGSAPSEDGCVPRPATACGGGDRPRKDQPERMGELPVDALDLRLEWARGPQPLSSPLSCIPS